MGASMAKLWFAQKGEIFEDDGPSFHDPLEENWYTELEEFRNVLSLEANQLIGEFHQFIPYFEEDIQQPRNSWKTLGLLKWGIANKEKIALLPQLKKFLQSHQEIVGCFISKMEPGASILEHSGMCNANYRCHLGLIVPSNDVSLLGIQVKNKARAWSKNELLTFVDANKHFAWNKTEEDRYVLIFDILRPQFSSRRLFILSRIYLMVALSIGANKTGLNQLYKLPSLLLNILAYCLYPLTAWILFAKRV